MSKKPFNVLFLCTGNSARSVMAEALLKRMGGGRFQAYSAGSQPAGRVSPYALELLAEKGFSTEGLRSKSWDEFAAADAPELDMVITVCSHAAGEQCPVWPGQPLRAHWGIDDPAAVEGSDIDKRRAFLQAFHRMQARIAIFVAMPMAKMDTAAIKARLDDIGRLKVEPAA